jgi:hypothetical protein
MQVKLDNTALTCLQRCEVEFTWRHVRNVAPTAFEASAHFGQIVHVGVRALYDGATVAEAQAKMRAAWTRDVEALAVANVLQGGARHCVVCGGWGGDTKVTGTSASRGRSNATCTCTVPDFVPTLDPNKLHLSLWRAYMTVHKYAEQWFERTVSGSGEPATNRMFDCVWNEGYAESATECALPDRAVRSRADGLLYAMDTKTTGLFVSQDWQRSFEHSQQAAIQLDVLEATLGEPVAGFWLDAIHVRRSGAPQADDFVRYGPLRYSAELRDELRQQRGWKAQRAADLRLYPQAAVKSPAACVRYGSLCPYFDLCKAAPAEREALLQIALARGTLKEEAWLPQSR